MLILLIFLSKDYKLADFSMSRLLYRGPAPLKTVHSKLPIFLMGPNDGQIRLYFNLREVSTGIM